MKISTRISAVLSILIVVPSLTLLPSASAWSSVENSVSVFGGQGNEEARSMALDRNGNIYSTGYFTGTVDFDPGEGVVNLTSLGLNDIFILKLNAAGNFLWVKRLGGTESEAAATIAIDREGNVVISGNFKGTVDSDPGEAIANLTSEGDDDVLIAKLDSSGNYIWAKNFGGTGRDSGLFVAVDMSGNICLTGIFSNTVDSDPGIQISNLTSMGGLDVFLAKFDPSGNYLWSNGRGGSGTDVGQSTAIDGNGNVYSVGYFNQSVDFDPSDGVSNLASLGGTEVFISKFDSAGGFLWAKRIGDVGSDGGNSVIFDSSGNLLVTGYFTGQVDFDPNGGVVNLTSAVSGENFISKFDTAGNLLWAKRIGGSGADRGINIAVDSDGNIYSTGYFNGTVDFDSSERTVNLTSSGSRDIFISKFDASGNILWAKRIGGNGDDRGISIAVDSLGNSYTSGYFSRTTDNLTGSIDFDPGDGSTNLTSTGAYDIFVLKLNPLGEVDIIGARAAANAVREAAATAAATIREATARAAADSAAKAAAAKQEAEKQSARANVAAAIKDAKELTVESFAKAQIPGITASNIGEVQAELLALPVEARADINQVLKVARKYEVVGIIASDQVKSVQPSTLVEIGLIPESSKNKVALAAAIKKLPAEARDSLTEIKAALEAANVAIQKRADRLANILAKQSVRSGK
ncbi:MAG: hypothetical protein RL130_1112 [Actinomycetota bacterium]|jgi:hypothetical protein